ncbi:TIM barrel protein [Clostridium aminobutyricum]|uniref:TIM barrel protein n=1 Tax=Clostridium aminobutyricum TaxID=33953 RepID=A0A939IGZ6_CLOAM|nr:TIM barrel protein [Clostridium aminobutyricum]MBN7774220.1 TIM barrel protein [Clostridium aminobutyricum]
MEHILSIPSYHEALLEYDSNEDLRESYEKFGCEGLEMIRCDDDVRGIITKEMVKGLHMIFYPEWLDFWLKDEKELIHEFGEASVWESFYRGKTFESVMSQFEADLDFAFSMEAEYVVFHISDVTISGVFTHQHKHSDEEVIDAAAEIINTLLDGKRYDFYFLMENLWWPGLTMTNPEMTKRLLEKVHYRKKGIMLDVGHLLCSNMELENQEEACQYIHTLLDAHDQLDPELCKSIKGIHLHQSISGEYAKKILANPPRLRDNYYERFAQVYELLGSIDTHMPWETAEISKVIERIQPLFLVHELMAKNRKHREILLRKQMMIL